jgi:hypothetical protein
MGENWLRTNSFVETVSALETFVDELCLVENEAYRWKCAVLALHGALQGMMVLALQGSRGLHVLREPDATRWLGAHARGGLYPIDLKLDDFLNLYDKIKHDLMLMFDHSSKFSPKGTQGRLSSSSTDSETTSRISRRESGRWSLVALQRYAPIASTSQIPRFRSRTT